MLTLAETPASLDGVPAEFVKYFLQVAITLLGVWVMMRKAGGRREDPLHVQQPITTERKPIYAEKKEVDARLLTFDGRLLAIESTMNDRYRQILEKGHEREIAILNAIADMKTELSEKIDDSLQAAYSRINSNDAKLAHLEGQFSATSPKPPKQRD